MWCVHTCKENFENFGTKSNAAIRNAVERKKQVTFKNCVPFTEYTSKMNKSLIDNTMDLDIEMLMYNIMEYSNNYEKHQKVYGSITKIIQMIT